MKVERSWPNAPNLVVQGTAETWGKEQFSGAAPNPSSSLSEWKDVFWGEGWITFTCL